ncbi:unnamed protein product [Adineta steineri]|uniref:G-protein coupled receptors family 1 profile domain-containing protein n=1 Tax=Adineta steineri TaxID=433720 RepID=A0A814LB52_9BILA|nr:unnamed protein product [Adineta steineri]CAF1161082.1 unnamed protein product [Adineta steineri]
MSSPSPSASSILVSQMLTYSCRFAGPVLLFIGTIGCSLNLTVFCQKTLRRSPCANYFIAYNTANILYIYCGLLFLTISLGYQIDRTTSSLVLCRLHLYTALLFHSLSQFYLILASVDRVLITSHHALTRRRSTHYLARISIVIGTIFLIIFHSHALIFPNIIQIIPHVFICNFEQSWEGAFINYYTIFKETLLLLLMIIFGLKSIHNIRNIQHARVAPEESTRATIVDRNIHSTSSKDRQLVLILIGDITMYALFSFIFAIYLIYMQITTNTVKTFDRTQIENNLRNVCLFLLNIPCCISFYLNFIISKSFRSEVKKIFIRN